MDDDEPAASLPEPAAAAGFSAFTQQPQTQARVTSPSPIQASPAGGSARGFPAPIVPTPTGGSGRSASARSPPPPVPLSRGVSSLSTPTSLPAAPKHINDFFDSTPTDENPPELSAQSAELGNLQNQVSQTQRSVSNLRGQRTKLAEDVGKTESQIAELKVSLGQAKAAYDVESTNMTNLETRQTKGSEELKTLREQTIRAESDLSALKEQKIELEQGILKDKEEMRDLRSKLKISNDEVAALKEQLEKLKKEARQQKGMLVVNKKQLATSEGEKEKVQRNIGAEREEIQRAAAAPPATPSFDSPPPVQTEEMRSPVLPASNRASPGPNTPSGRSNNPFDRMINVVASGAAAALPVVGLAVPDAVAHAARASSPLHDAFSAPQQQQAEPPAAVSPHRPAEKEQDPFGMSTSTGSLPPQQQQMPSSSFGFDDDFGSAFGAPAQLSNTASQQPMDASRQKQQPAIDFDGAFADFDQPSRRAPPPPPKSSIVAEEATERKEAPGVEVRAASPVTAQAPLEANQDQFNPGPRELAASPSATVPFMSVAPTTRDFEDSAGGGAGAGYDDEEHVAKVMSPLSSRQPYASRELPAEGNAASEDEGEGTEDLPPIADINRPDSPDSELEEEERTQNPENDQHLSSQPEHLDNPAEELRIQDKGKGKAIDAYPGAYPGSEDEDSFEDARANLTETSASPMAHRSPASPTASENASVNADSFANPTEQGNGGPTYNFAEIYNNPNNIRYGNGVNYGNESAFEQSKGPGNQAPDLAKDEASYTPSTTAGLTQTGMTAAKEAERPRPIDDFDDFEDLSP